MLAASPSGAELVGHHTCGVVQFGKRGMFLKLISQPRLRPSHTSPTEGGALADRDSAGKKQTTTRQSRRSCATMATVKTKLQSQIVVFHPI